MRSGVLVQFLFLFGLTHAHRNANPKKQLLYSKLFENLPNLIEIPPLPYNAFTGKKAKYLGDELASDIGSALISCDVNKDNLGLINFMPGFFSEFKLTKEDYKNPESLVCFLENMGWVDASNNVLREDVKLSLSKTSLEAERTVEADQRCHDKAYGVDFESIIRFIISGGNLNELTGASINRKSHVFNDEERAMLVDQISKLIYFSCLRQSLIEQCINDATGSLSLAPSIDAEEFSNYWVDQGLIPAQFSKPPPPAVVNIQPGVTVSKPGLRIPPDMFGNVPTTAQWCCDCDSTCPSGLYTYIVEDIDVPFAPPGVPKTFIHNVVYNAPCNDIPSGQTGIHFLRQFSMDLELTFPDPSNPTYVEFAMHNPPRDPNFHHRYLHQVYCQTKELTEADFGSHLQTSECDPINSVVGPRTNHATLIDKLELIPDPVAASAIHLTSTKLSNILACAIQTCVGFENFSIVTSSRGDICEGAILA